MSQIFFYGEKIFVICSLLYFTRGVNLLVSPALVSLFRYGTGAFAFFFLILLGVQALNTIKKDKWILIVVFLSAISFIWSEYADYTTELIKTELFQMSAFGIYLSTRFTLRQQLNFLIIALSMAMFLSFVVAATMPSMGISEEGLFRGIFDHKNDASAYGILAALASFSLALDKSEKKSSLMGWLVFGVAIIFVLATTSKTGLVLSIFIPLAITFYIRSRWKGEIIAIILPIIVLVVYAVLTLIISQWHFLLSAIGGDPTLTGRTDIWRVSLEHIAERPWLGFGRGAFWFLGSQTQDEVSNAVAAFGFTAPHAHNGYIDLLLDIGLIGGFCFAISLIKLWVHSFKLAYSATMTEQIWPLAFAIFITINNVTESYLLWNTNLFWVIYISTSISAKKLSPRKLRAMSAASN
ncbi:MAG: O-antigen ligase family protein [Cyanobacteria bacterium P01_B01_bin.77]